jgi:hypothetical protein
MPLVSDVLGLFRFAAGLATFLGEPLSTEDAKSYVRQRMQLRDQAFLDMVARAVFANPTSPYRRLFAAAGCELDDVSALVRREGLEGALGELRRAGVYVTFEEFKGQAPAVRGSSTFHFCDDDFDNPLITSHFQSSSGGTRGRPSRVKVDLDHIAQAAPSWALWFAAHDWLDRPLVYWTPTHAGIVNGQLRCAKFGKEVERWFAIVEMGKTRLGLISEVVHRIARRAAGFPKPELVPLDDADKVGDYLVRATGEGVRPCLNTYASAAVRICLAMGERGRRLDGVTFLLRGEPLTPARRDVIEASGAEVVQTYGFAEGGPVASQCPNRGDAPDDVHVYLDAFAITQRPRETVGGQRVDALLLTALRPAAPKILLNTEIGDCGVLEERDCGCLFDEVGYRTHLHTIRSFEKLTGEGMTILAADLHHVLERGLPSRFGGTVTDYQLVEQEDGRGLVRYSLFVSPEVKVADDGVLAAAFLEELGKLKIQYPFMVSLWSRADVLRVVRQRPLQSARGKTMPFRTLGL